eukprot:2560162-Rhodomonas_salina.2
MLTSGCERLPLPLPVKSRAPASPSHGHGVCTRCAMRLGPARSLALSRALCLVGAFHCLHSQPCQCHRRLGVGLPAAGSARRGEPFSSRPPSPGQAPSVTRDAATSRAVLADESGTSHVIGASSAPFKVDERGAVQS